VADNARWECDLKPVNFRPTMMFQTRSHAFTLRNLSKAALTYAWRILAPDGSAVPQPFSVRPETGSIAAGATGAFTLKFSPQEVEEERTLTLVADIPGADGGQAPLRVPLRGRVLRPWCHFELPESDYLSSGRRVPGAPAGAVDASTRVLEFSCPGRNDKARRRPAHCAPAPAPHPPGRLAPLRSARLGPRSAPLGGPGPTPPNPQTACLPLCLTRCA